MSEFDFPKNWTITLPRGWKKDKQAIKDTIKLDRKTRPEVMREIKRLGLVSYKLESEEI